MLKRKLINYLIKNFLILKKNKEKKQIIFNKKSENFLIKCKKHQ